VFLSSNANGRKRYGSHFKDYTYFTVLHNTDVYCYHHSLAFLTR